MSALLSIESELLKLGYSTEAIIRDYKFADVLSAGGEQRHVELAAFTQVPESYRSAAFGVISGDVSEVEIARRRSLGAPILFSIGPSDVGVWRVGAEGGPRLIERVSISGLSELFRRHAQEWSPLSVHRAKSLGQNQAAYQLDFVDLGLIPAIEHEVELKLARLLEDVIRALLNDLSSDQEIGAFRVTFRLLAAKILADRQHPAAASWADAPVGDVLAGIEAYYGLGKFSETGIDELPKTSVDAAWQLLRQAISFRNISSDSLAFVYENTLVTTDTRKRFGTHSTPRQVAEFLVSKLDLSRFDLPTLSIFEPFTGAGTLLVAALRRLRDYLPSDWSAEQRHAFLVPRVRGAEIDSFACEVATLSLILADYPNANGWKIATKDLFEGKSLAEELASATIVLCNPPWEDFDLAERTQYPEIATRSLSKPMAVLRTVLDSKPPAIGFVLPQGFLRQKQYAELRQKIADLYGNIELTSLPDRTFQQAGFETALLVASDRRPDDSVTPSKLVSTVVEDRDRLAFLSSGVVTAERRRQKLVSDGGLWVGALDELWEYVDRYPHLGSKAEIYRGLQWVSQDDGRCEEPRRGYARGVFKPADSLVQFGIKSISFLDVREESAYRLAPLSRPWHLPKVLTNVARLSRGPWRIAAAYDTSGLVASQAFFGIWTEATDLPGEALEAILNGPLTNAFVAERASNQHFTNELLKRLPVPKTTDYRAIVDAVHTYKSERNVADQAGLVSIATLDHLASLLIDIDAQVLKAYDLPPRIERRLLEYFRGHESERRTGHGFGGWLPENFKAFVPLHEYRGPLVQANRGPWATKAFEPAPKDEVDILRRFVR
ncbi:N-6 DNA methylase [Allorhizobium borbori]|jgi:hypothetical protein|uniref:DNA methylase adenine-specific domain-containing protein n=1 Tax=Allorhizobium borbori TaxID=485907 RepID=A0A7W6K0J3_9HYPH|nr:N-6 DNA methylase [Allorhizobium borbori]MBB4102948.1 hypothetical protein [Allorhizobium borbori]